MLSLGGPEWQNAALGRDLDVGQEYEHVLTLLNI